jgi:hypothetical protein
MGLLDSVEKQERVHDAEERRLKKIEEVSARQELSSERRKELIEKANKRSEKERMGSKERVVAGAKRVFTSTPVRLLDKGVRAVSKVAVKEIKQARPWDVQGRPREEQQTRPGSYRMPGRPKSPRHSKGIGGFDSPTYHKGEAYIQSPEAYDTGLYGNLPTKKRSKGKGRGRGLPNALNMSFDWRLGR